MDAIESEMAEAGTPTMRLLVVEDDRKLVRALARGLEREGYAVDVAYTGEEALAQASAGDYDAVVLDVMLPGVDGFSVCEELRRQPRWMPVLMLTARADVADRIRGLDAGADDYLVKPFDFGELLARLRALGRRSPLEAPAVLEVGELRFDPATRVVSRAGMEVELTAREFEVLELLARHGGQVVSRQRLLEEIWHDDYDGSPNIVDVYVGYLRKKLEGPSGPRLIRTVRGVGFRLELE
jgi:two-component system, OmpR family, response regulator